ncbi:hypothetical protein CsSME_00000762 [Camellia sinensis var. sinensis]
MCAIIGIIGSAAFILFFCFTLLALWCNWYNLRAPTPTQPPPPPPPSTTHFDIEMPSRRIEMTSLSSIRIVSETQLIALPSYNYTKDIAGLVSKTYDQTCVVCLSDFVDGEPFRVLPECLHPFHVPCIDMWLYSHSNCPVCRTDVTPAETRLALMRSLPLGGEAV